MLRTYRKLIYLILLGLLLSTPFSYTTLAATTPNTVHQSGDPITIKSIITLTDDPLNGETVLLAGLSAEPNGKPAVLSAELQMKTSGWFPSWYVTVQSAGGLIPAELIAAHPELLQLGPVYPAMGHTYAVTLSYHPALGYLSLSIYDQTDTKLMTTGNWRLAPYAGELYGVAGTKASVSCHPWYEPFTTWDVGKEPQVEFTPFRFLEPNETSLIRFTALGPLPGEYRVLSAAHQQLALLPGSQLVAGANWISFPATELPLGSNTISLQYVDQGQVRFSENQSIVVGKLKASMDNASLNQATGQLVSNLTLQSQSVLHDVALKLEVDISSLSWNAATSSYIAKSHSTVAIDLGRIATISSGKVALPIAVAVPDQSGIWRANYKLTASPDIVTEVSVPSVSFSTQSWTLLGNEALTVTTDHADALYKVGEPVTFQIRVTQNGQPVNGVSVQWWLKKDGGTPLDSGVSVVENGDALITGSLNEPGFMQLQATYVFGAQSLTVTAGAGVDPLAITPSMPVPDDFDAFWAEKKALLAQVPLRAQAKPVNSGSLSIDAYDVQVDALGAPVSGYLALPKNAKPGTLPAIISLHGAGVRSAYLSSATAWAQRGMLAMDINAHGLLNGMSASYYEALNTGELADYRVRGVDSRDDFYFLGMFLRVVRAIDYLTSRPEWDGKTIILYGASQGGAQAIAGAALDARVTFFVAGVPALADLTGKIVNRATGWPGSGFTSHSSSVVQANRINTVRYFDVMNMATRVKADGFFTVGFIDTTCAPTTVYAAYNNVKTNKQIYNQIYAGHTTTPEASSLMLAAVLDHVAKMKQQGLPK